MYPGFWSCDTVGTNHPVHPDTCCALVFASFLEYQSLPTSALRGLTIQFTPPERHIRNPPPKEEPSVGAVTVSVAVAAVLFPNAFPNVIEKVLVAPPLTVVDPLVAAVLKLLVLTTQVALVEDQVSVADPPST
jgi:hypothetical protein